MKKMKKLHWVLLCIIVIPAYSQLNWKKGGNNELPANSTPSLGTTYNGELRIITNNTERILITPDAQTKIGIQAFTNATNFIVNPATTFHIGMVQALNQGVHRTWMGYSLI
jgi:hypothetical protein